MLEVTDGVAYELDGDAENESAVRDRGHRLGAAQAEGEARARAPDRES